MPILIAVPSIIFIALSILVVFKSGNLIFAISSKAALSIEPTLILFGFEEPFGIFNAFLINTEAGGVFRIKVNVLSS